MDSKNLIAEINDVFESGFEIPREKLTPESNLFGDLGLDSLDAVDMLVHLEEKLDIKVDGDRLMQLKTLGDVYEMVGELAESSQAQPKLSN